MRRAWDAVFTAPVDVQRPRAPTLLTLDAPIGAAGMSPAVLAVLERLGVTTLGAALSLSAAQVVWTPGIGTKTRRELRAELDQLAKKATSVAERPNELTCSTGSRRLSFRIRPTARSRRRCLVSARPK